jgi:hypothetical protein
MLKQQLNINPANSFFIASLPDKTTVHIPLTVIPAKAGIQYVTRAAGANSRCFASNNNLDSGFRRNDVTFF